MLPRHSLKGFDGDQFAFLTQCSALNPFSIYDLNISNVFEVSLAETLLDDKHPWRFQRLGVPASNFAENTDVVASTLMVLASKHSA